MRKLLLAVILILFFCAAAAHAESDMLAGAPYMAHLTGWYNVECEKIYVQNSQPRFHLDSDDMSMNLGAYAMPIGSRKTSLTYSSSDESTIKVDENGNITAENKAGSAVVTISSDDISVEIPVEVIRGVSGVALSEKDLTFYADRPVPHKISAVISPSDASDKSVKWQSSDTSIASVDENGTITPVGVGTAKITAVTNDGGFKADCTARVTIYDIPVRAIFIENAIEALRINGDYQLTSYIYPQNARNKAMSWASSDSSIVTVDENGNLHGVSEGNAMITATASNGAEDTFTINIVPDDGNPFEFKVISEPISERIAKLSMPVVYSQYKHTLDSAIRTQLTKSPVIFTTFSSPASESDVRNYINPANFSSGSEKYQFALLDRTNGISETALNAYLSNKGVLSGKGSIILAAAKQNSISEIYLAVHAALESGNGASELARGIDFNGTVVYNLFGIGAYDKDPVNEGAKYAYEQGWTDIDKAIYGGAKWISENYINASSKQNTLYKMRWNPANPGVHQYATDIAWAAKQSKIIYAMFSSLPYADVTFDIPVYRGENEVPVSYE